jgi:hypothetical protein
MPGLVFHSLVSQYFARYIRKEILLLMAFTYSDISTWMREYWNAYNEYAQNNATVSRMCDYFAPDLEFIPYTAQIAHMHTMKREDFFSILTGHPRGFERFTPEDIAIDERRGVVVSLLKAEIHDSKTATLLLTKRYLVHYKLVTDEDGKLKIKTILFFWEELLPGSLDVSEAFEGLPE